MTKNIFQSIVNLTVDTENVAHICFYSEETSDLIYSDEFNALMSSLYALSENASVYDQFEHHSLYMLECFIERVECSQVKLYAYCIDNTLSQANQTRLRVMLRKVNKTVNTLYSTLHDELIKARALSDVLYSVQNSLVTSILDFNMHENNLTCEQALDMLMRNDENNELFEVTFEVANKKINDRQITEHLKMIIDCCEYDTAFDEEIVTHCERALSLLSK